MSFAYQTINILNSLYCTYKNIQVSQLMAMVGLSLKEISSSQPMDVPENKY
jgi:hypothetical protein